MNRAYSYDIVIDDKRDKFGNGHTGIIFAKTKEKAKRRLLRRFIYRKEQKLISLEITRINTGLYEIWNYTIDRKRLIKLKEDNNES